MNPVPARAEELPAIEVSSEHLHGKEITRGKKSTAISLRERRERLQSHGTSPHHQWNLSVIERHTRDQGPVPALDPSGLVAPVAVVCRIPAGRAGTTGQ